MHVAQGTCAEQGSPSSLTETDHTCAMRRWSPAFFCYEASLHAARPADPLNLESAGTARQGPRLFRADRHRQEEY